MKKPQPERRCIATGQTEPASGLVRFVVGPDNQIVPDIMGKLPGRGIWVSADADAIGTAAQKGLFSRAAKASVNVPDDLVEQVAQALSRRVAETLALARKAGLAVAGYEKVKTLLVTDEAAALFQAKDGSDAMKKKLRAPSGDATYVNWLSADELGLAFGRDRVIHAAIKPGGLSVLCLAEAARLAGFRRDEGKIGAAR
jgi:predicted RNA-binding protein YlxR (DUF448 family)